MGDGTFHGEACELAGQETGRLSVTRCAEPGTFDGFLNEIMESFDKDGERIDSRLAEALARSDSLEIQDRLRRIRDEHRIRLKEALMSLRLKERELRERLESISEARAQVGLMELHAKMVDSLRIFKAQAAERYESELDKLLTSLPEEMRDKAQAIRSSEDCQGRRAEAVRRIGTCILEFGRESAFRFRDELKRHFAGRLAELDAATLAKMESLQSQPRELR